MSPPPDTGTFGRRALVAGIAGAAGCVALGIVWPARFFAAYLVAWLLAFGVALGSMALLMLHHLVGGGWGHVSRRALEAATRTLPYLAALFLPLVLGLTWLYPWSRPGALADPLLAKKAIWLSVPFFLARAAVYFAIWIGLATVLSRWSARQDEAPPGAEGEEAPFARRFRHLSAPGLAAYGLTVTFAAVDWVMSLDPHWYSTIYGVLFICGQGVATLSFVVVALAALARRPPLDAALGPGHLNDFGNLMLAFVMLWAYVSFSQFLIIWSGNLAEEIPWYELRLAPGRRGVALALIALHFALPFVLLLWRQAKRSLESLASIAALLLLMRFVDLHWIVAPSARGAAGPAIVPEMVALVAVGGLWLAALVRELGRRPLLPRHAPAMPGAARRHGEAS